MTMNEQSWRTVPEMFFAQADRLGERPLVWSRQPHGWTALTWAEAARQVRALAASLAARGLRPGDRVMLLAENRPEWAVADLAIMAAGGVSVPAYTAYTEADLVHILTHSEARFAIVSRPPFSGRLLAASVRVEPPPVIIAMDGVTLRQASGAPVLAWADMLAEGEDPGFARERDARLAAAKRTDIACLIYTSGTGGMPKGVMLSHGALLANCEGTLALLRDLPIGDEVFLSFLPLSHSYEHTAGLIFPIAIGAQIYYAEGVEQLAANMAEVRPTVMIAVPRLYEVMRRKILHAAPEGGWRARLLELTVRLGRRRASGQRLGLAKPVDLALDLVVRRAIRARFGGRLKAMVSGGAPLDPELGLFLAALGLPVLQGYGQTETAPVVSCNPPRRPRMDTVGVALGNIEVRIAEDGELWVKGESTMRGYWKDGEATSRAMPDGHWVQTGDIATIDADGYIRITDRKKDIIVTSGGDTLSPQRIEGRLTLQPEIAQAFVFGDRHPHLVALIVPADDGTEDPREAVDRAVARVNGSLAGIERIRRFALCPQPFTIENGMLTPTLKIRRHVIRATYGETLAGLYDADAPVSPTKPPIKGGGADGAVAS